MQTTCSSTHGSWLATVLLMAPSVVSAQSPQRAPDNPYALTSEDNPYAHAAEAAESPYEQQAAMEAEGADAETAGDDAEDADDDARIRIHRFGLGMSATSFATEQTLGFTFLGPGIMHEYFVGRRWGFATRLGMGFPLMGHMVDTAQNINSRVGLAPYYDERRFEADALLMAARRFEWTSKLEFMVGFGLHVHSIRLLGAKYLPIDGITGGFGGLAHLDYRLHEMFSIGGEVAVGVDPLDFVDHRNRMAINVPVALSFTFSVRR